MKIPLRQGRRRTTLPALPPRPHPTPALAGALLKECYIEPLREALNRTSFFDTIFEADPWDEAVRHIERIHEAREEWPWPASN